MASATARHVDLMLDEGAEWPRGFTSWRSGHVWPLATVKWALSEGYKWQGWRCQQYTLALSFMQYDLSDTRQYYGLLVRIKVAARLLQNGMDKMRSGVEVCVAAITLTSQSFTCRSEGDVGRSSEPVLQSSSV
jgi:hypothetical protein